MELRDDLRDATAPVLSGPSSPGCGSSTDALRTEARPRSSVGAGSAAAALAIVAACLLACLVGVRAVHPRDEADFLLAADAEPRI